MNQFQTIAGNTWYFFYWTNTGVLALAQSFKFIRAEYWSITQLPSPHHSLINPLLALNSLWYMLIRPKSTNQFQAVAEKIRNFYIEQIQVSLHWPKV